MARPLSLAAYLALRGARFGGAAEEADWPQRPELPVVWVHGPAPLSAELVRSLHAGLAEEGEQVAFVLTFALGEAVPEVSAEIPAVVIPAPVQAGDAGRFMAHWAPDVLVWVGDHLDPTLIDASRNIVSTRILVGAGQPEQSLLQPAGPRLPGVARAILGLFDHALCDAPAAATRLQRSGMPAARIETPGPMEPPPPVLGCVESDRQDLSQTLGPRPVWLVAHALADEMPALIAAYKAARRRAHRLLLIAAGPDLIGLANALALAGLTVVDHAAGEMPDASTDVILADEADIGLWLRLSPVTFMGGTLTGAATARDPMEAAALGSVVMHGGHVTPHQQSYARLHASGACRAVPSSGDLGAALTELLSAERAAHYAQAAWDVSSRGAEACARLNALVQAALDRVGA